ncbi:suppressor of disruption of TFIIS [Iris pallida]|uniref:Suppressor of disruption of TFIIS n=1 Tax=Iris pallida TaxID=29817 RepID=A0AAX6EI60_IRIPA|nr:suppressor of disruption of TFIIS [Iris pallida]
MRTFRVRALSACVRVQGLPSVLRHQLFDLDDTLYSSSLGIAKACRQNIEDFLAAKCGVSADMASSLRTELFCTYGSSLAGLLEMGYDVHPDEYHSFVHGRLPYENIKPEPQLRDLLRSISKPKFIFTNSDMKHAKRVLERLGIEEECFELIICFETLNPHLFLGKKASSQVILKPSVRAIEAAVRLAGYEPHRTLFLDDSERNIAAGKAVGLRTALVGKRVKTDEADYLVRDMDSLRHTIPEIWMDKLEELEEDGSGDEHSAIMVLRNEVEESVRSASTTVMAYN